MTVLTTLRESGAGTESTYLLTSSRRYGRAPKYKKRTSATQLDAEVASILETRPDLTLVALADGAEENWRYFDGPTWESATKIVDHGHAFQHSSRRRRRCHLIRLCLRHRQPPDRRLRGRRAAPRDVVGVVGSDCDAVDGLGGRDDAAAVVGDEALDEDVDAT